MGLGRLRRIKIRGCNYAVWTSGSGPLVVLLHGWPVTSYHWRFLAPKLNQAGFSTVCIDLRGLGQSVCKNARHLEKASIAKDLKALLKVLDPALKSYSIVGHDWGGTIAFALAAQDRRRVRKLVVEEELLPGISAEIPKPGSRFYPVWHGAFHRMEGLAEKMITGREAEYIGYFLCLRRDPNSLNAKDFRQYLRFYRGRRAIQIGLSYYRTNEADAKFFRKLQLHPLTLPILAVGGRYAMGPSVKECVKQVATNVHLKLFERSGHYPAEEEPTRFASQVVRFLD